MSSLLKIPCSNLSSIHLPHLTIQQQLIFVSKADEQVAILILDRLVQVDYKPKSLI